MLGKGIGESILVCLRPGDWVIVDSFRTPGSGNPAAIDYLNGRGVRPETDVAAVILSHLHADHSDGIDDLLVRCPRATFSMPAAVPEEHWNRVLERLLSEEPPRSDKLQEIANAFRLAMDTGRFRPMAVDSFVNTEPPELSALAPLAAAQLAAHKATAPAAAAAARAFSARTTRRLCFGSGRAPRRLSLALTWIAMKPLAGVPSSRSMRERLGLLSPQRLVKVPHHGSGHAHEPAVYATWTDGSLAVLTPNRSSRLPTATVVNELKDLCAGVWQAGPRAGLALKDLSVRASAEVVAIEFLGSRRTGQWTVNNAYSHRL